MVDYLKNAAAEIDARAMTWAAIATTGLGLVGWTILRAAIAIRS